MDERSIRTVVVDDQDDIRLLMRLIIEASGIAVTEASSGEEALALLDELAPDAIVLDVMMPGMDGVETARRIRAQHPDIPKILFCSAHLDAAMAAQIDVIRGEACLSKEDVGRLPEVLGELLA